MPNLRQAEGADDVLVLRRLPGEPCRLEGARGVPQEGEEALAQATEDGGVAQERIREIAEGTARTAEQSGDAYEGLLAEGARYCTRYLNQAQIHDSTPWTPPAAQTAGTNPKVTFQEYINRAGDVKNIRKIKYY